MRMIARYLGATLTTVVCVGLLLAATTACASLQVTTGNPGLTHFDTDGGVSSTSA